MQIPPMEV